MTLFAMPSPAAGRSLLAAVLGLGLLVAGCSATSSATQTVAAATATAGATPTATASASPTDTPTPTSSDSPSPTPTPATTSKPAPKVTPLPPLAIGLCRGAQLKLTITAWQNNGTSSYAHVTAQNVSSAACNMRGTSQALFLNGHGSVIAGSGSGKVSVSDTTYPLNPGDSINTIITWDNWCKPAPAQKVTVEMVQPFGLGGFKAKANGNAPIPSCLMSNQKSSVSSEKWLP